MAKRQTIQRARAPHLILLSDARNDAALARAIARLPRGSALVFRHYHLPAHERRRRFAELRRLARARGISMIGARVPTAWGGEGVYGTAREVAGRRGIRLATAHSLGEVAAAARAGADAVLLSPVHPTRSHPGAPVLGPVRFLLLARRSPLPVIALGGMTARRAARLPVHGWAAIDGLA
ncbi:thiamine monophosphate synthase [Novosphingobium aromaticivorans DSM 12444]|uniref:Thiamine monophosphate synthase n=1 Tax=Novosphingobium aromaticivorans (strain ATCC 700278 / DSM 12444 / CCUG 56034 / CIP 105152 / NBRC 16084 / F199) TaxID=279238 RepID=Q2GB91_NOVAD|nr:thiamine phosphate synthase [Novosphingobium aromaticivorans]ABD24882.1 thiamine monophosphate synthase [Novosphingobium aromaticivorans DSM 12444]SCY14667.1 thiamine-phosphate pyrophosphorylase [Novosphingobium aromaticivorans]